jgi:chromosome partitioning protein
MGKVFVRSKKIVFANNKGGVGKTTLCFNIGVELAKAGYRVCFIDLDPQANLTRICLGDKIFGDSSYKTVYNVLKGVIEGGGDIDTDIAPMKLSNKIFEDIEIYVLPGDLRLSVFENSLQTAMIEAKSGNPIGYFRTSALQRYIDRLGVNKDFDIFLIDTGPSLGLLNNVIFLSSDYFIVPMMPDSFSVQGIENLGTVFSAWKKEWDITGRNLAKHNNITSDKVLDGAGIFLGYIINQYNIKNGNPLKDQQKWILEIPEKVKIFLSEKHCKNGLVELSYKTEIGRLKDAGKLTPLGQIVGKSIPDITRKEIGDKHHGTMQSQEVVKEELKKIGIEISNRLHKY